MSKEEQMLVEYTSLRAEIVGDQTRSTNVFVFSITVTPAILGLVSIASVSPFLFLGALLVLLPSRIYIDELDRAIMQKSRYIREDIESKLEGLRWETIMHREKNRTRGGWHVQATSISVVYALLGFASVALFVNTGRISQAPLVVYATALVVLAAVILVTGWVPYKTHHL